MCFKKKNKKVENKPAEVKQVKSKPAEKKADVNDDIGYRNYHVVKRSDGKWEVKFAGGKKAIKLFATQVEAVEYTKKMADNQDGAVLVHNSKGKNKGRIKSK